MYREMLKKSLVLTVLCLVAFSCATAKQAAYINESDYSAPIRVACIGDSITYGAGIDEREKNCYPARLGELLGPKWDVRNFGVSGATLLKKGDKPYWNETAYQDAMAFAPNVVVIKLGTNDTKPQNWKYCNEYVGDYEALIKSFRELPGKPRVWICYPVPAYPGKWGIVDQIVKEQVIPDIDQIAKDTDVPIIDLYSALSNKSELFPDTVHPNAEGAELIAETVCEALTGKK